MDAGPYRAAAAAILAGGRVAAAYLFGSRARGDHRPESDVDIAVLLDEPLDDPLAWSLRRATEFSLALGLEVSPPVLLDSAPLRLQYRVLRDGVLIFEGRPELRVAYETRTRTVAGDFEIKARELDELLLAAHAAGGR